MLVGEMSFQVVSSRETILCFVDCIHAITVVTVEAMPVVLRLMSDEVLLAGECNPSGKAGWFMTTVKLVMVLPMFTIDH